MAKMYPSPSALFPLRLLFFLMSGSTAGPAGFMDFRLLRGNSRRRDLLVVGLLLHMSLESLTFNWMAAFCSDISMSNVSCSGLYDDPLDFSRVHCESQVGLEGTEERNTL